MHAHNLISMDDITMLHTVETEILTKGLCNGCGTCAGCCPSDAIQMKRRHDMYSPIVNYSKCNECKICIDACPAIADFTALNKSVFGQPPNEISIGNYLNCYVGYSTNPQIRWNSSSGGLVTTLLIFALNNGIIDGAITTKMSRKKPLEPEVAIAQSEAEIITSSKSKYCPVSVNTQLKSILDKKGKYAIVGLPCHIQGTRKAETVFKKLKAKIHLHMGIFCLHNINFAGTKILLEKVGVTTEDVVKLDYRGEGWPGKMVITLKNGTKRAFSYRSIWSALYGSFYFTPFPCTLCPDMTSELADISFGDAWLPEFKDNKEGISMLITRTERGEEILREAENDGKIKVKRISYRKVLDAHRLGIYFKKRNLAARLKLLKLTGNPAAENNGANWSSLQLLEPKVADFILAPLSYLNIRASSNRNFQKFLKYAPFPLLRNYTTVFNKIRTLAA